MSTKTTVLTGKRVSHRPDFDAAAVGLPRSVELNLVLNASGSLIPFSGESRGAIMSRELAFIFESAARVESRVVVQPLDVSRM